MSTEHSPTQQAAASGQNEMHNAIQAIVNNLAKDLIQGLQTEFQSVVDSAQQQMRHAATQRQAIDEGLAAIDAATKNMADINERLKAVEAAQASAKEPAKEDSPKPAGWRGFAQKYGALIAQSAIAVGTVAAVIHMNREPELAPGEIAGI